MHLFKCHCSEQFSFTVEKQECIRVELAKEGSGKIRSDTMGGFMINKTFDNEICKVQEYLGIHHHRQL